MLLERALAELDAQLIEALREIVGDHVLTELTDDVWETYCVDYIGNTGGPAIVIQPGSTAEVRKVVLELASRNIAWVIQGANTGLVEGSVPTEYAQVVISLLRLKGFKLHDDAQATVGAGLLLSEIQDFLEPHGVEFAVRLKANPSMGGMAATNAGGTRVVHHGMMRHHVVGVTIVLPTGEVIRRGMHGLAKDNTGPDFAQIAVGAEGMVGIITELRLKIIPIETGQTTAIVAVAYMADAVNLTRFVLKVYGSSGRLRVIEIFDETSRKLVDTYLSLPPLFGLKKGESGPGKFYLLIEVADPSVSDSARQEELSETLLGTDYVVDGVIAESAKQRDDFWNWREGITEALRTDVRNTGMKLTKLDVTVPLANQAKFYGWCQRTLTEYGILMVWFGHHGDDTIHLQLEYPASTRYLAACVHDILCAVMEMGGSISSEHGIGGSIKAQYLDKDWLDAIDRLRRAYDPAGLCNPQVFRVPTRT